MQKTLINTDIGMYPLAIQPYLHNARKYGRSCSEGAKTVFLDGELQAYLKTDLQGKLLRDKELTCFFTALAWLPKCWSISTIRRVTILSPQPWTEKTESLRSICNIPTSLLPAWGNT